MCGQLHLLCFNLPMPLTLTVNGQKHCDYLDCGLQDTKSEQSLLMLDLGVKQTPFKCRIICQYTLIFNCSILLFIVSGDKATTATVAGTVESTAIIVADCEAGNQSDGIAESK